MHRLVFVVLCVVLQCGSVLCNCSVKNYNCPDDAPCCSRYGYCGTGDHCKPEICVAGCDRVPENKKSSTLAFGASKAIKKSQNTDECEESQYDGDEAINFEAIPYLKDMGVYMRCSNPKHVALTFDDGIDPYSVTIVAYFSFRKLTPKLLTLLKAKGVKATFFIQGKTISKYSNIKKTERNKHYNQNRVIMRKMVTDGHTPLPHAFDHPNFILITKRAIVKQLEVTENLFKHVIGRQPAIIRVPFGSLSSRVLDVLHEQNYMAVHWSYDTDDWRYYKKKPTYMVDYIKNIPNAVDGEGPIILQHDVYKRTVEDQGRIIDILHKKGYEIVSMEVCIGTNPYRE